jgi:hypothetical protein
MTEINLKEIKSIFLAGVIQGSNKGMLLHKQDYREDLKNVLKKYLPEAEIIDPVEDHPDSAFYDYQEGEKVFHHSIKRCCGSDLVVAYIPEASMGTAIEMWECFKNKVPIWAVTPLKENWSVKFLCTEIFKSIEELERFLRNNSKK